MGFTRRDFLAASAAGFCSLVVSTGLSGCGGDDDDSTKTATFEYGVASGDPLNDKVIIWTRVTPLEGQSSITVKFEAATDAEFKNLTNSGTVEAEVATDYTVKVDLQNLQAGTTYYYRFKAGGSVSTVGTAKTLPVGDVSQVKMALFSCSNYPKGYFNAYTETAKIEDLDVAIHVGDYIYEYGMFEADGITPAYATERAVEIGRELPQDNDTECLNLDNYRRRYALYHTDSGLQTLHAKVPFIVVWDDHEIANDTYIDGAENHQSDTEGDFTTRKVAALQAFFEWLPVRPYSEGDTETIYRSFSFGNLVDLHMLDTRMIGRDKQLSYSDFITVDAQTEEMSIDTASFQAALLDSERTIMGSAQLAWLQNKLVSSTGTWQVLGQQVIMGRMSLPVELLTYVAALEGDLSDEEKAAIVAQANNVISELVAIKVRMLQGDPSLTEEEIARVTIAVPYNLDAWDGYFMERETVLQTALSADKNLVVLSGDSHNSWANDLKALNMDTGKAQYQAGVEFAGTSVSSPGMEEYFLLESDEAAQQLEYVWTTLVEDLAYTNQNNRGFVVVTFTADEAVADYYYVNQTATTDYTMLDGRFKSYKVLPGAGNRTLIEN